VATAIAGGDCRAQITVDVPGENPAAEKKPLHTMVASSTASPACEVKRRELWESERYRQFPPLILKQTPKGGSAVRPTLRASPAPGRSDRQRELDGGI